MSAENTPDAPKPETPAAPPAPQPPKPAPPKAGGKPIPDKWQRGGPPKAKPNPDAAVPRTFGEFKPNKRALDADMEAEMAAAFAGTDLKAMDADKPQGAKGEGGRKKGRVLSIHGKDVFVEIPGGRSEGMISLDEFEGKRPNVGDEIEFLVDHYDSANGLLVLTKEGAAKQVTDWSSVKLNMVVEAKITGMNKNQTGYTVEVNGIRGFMPLSQADMYRIEQPESLVNSKQKVQVIELDPQERNLIVSRRTIQEAERERKAVEFWATIKEGDVHKGIVKSIKPFGAFVDLGGADGLIPIGELSWSRVGTVEEVLKVGQLVEVKVARLDPEARKIGLSLRAMQTSPWETFAAEHRPGLRVPGKVTRVMEFGAFVEIAPGIEGLIHVSELSTGRVNRVRDVIKEGQDVTVQILSIDTEARRIALSLKAMVAEAEAAEDAAATAEAEADKAAAAERLANRKPTGNLRGGIGGGAVRFEIG